MHGQPPASPRKARGRQAALCEAKLPAPRCCSGPCSGLAAFQLTRRICIISISYSELSSGEKQGSKKTHSSYRLSGGGVPIPQGTQNVVPELESKYFASHLKFWKTLIFSYKRPGFGSPDRVRKASLYVRPRWMREREVSAGPTAPCHLQETGLAAHPHGHSVRLPEERPACPGCRWAHRPCHPDLDGQALHRRSECWSPRCF